MSTFARFTAVFCFTLAASAAMVGSPVHAETTGAASTMSADNTVAPRGDVEVKRYAVKLSDVFTGVPSEIDRDIAQAPAPCKRMVYDVNVLSRLAQKYRLDWAAQGNEHVSVTSACTRISSEAISGAVIQHMKDSGVKGDIDVVFDNRALEIALPADQSAYFDLNNFVYDPSTKRFRGDVVAESGNGPIAVPVMGRVVVRQNVPVLRHRLAQGTIVGNDDLDWVAMPEDRINGSIVTDASQIIGHELRRDTDGNISLRYTDVMPPRHVTRGSLVTLKIETPFMQLTAQGKALQDGAEGDVVRVTNTQSNRTVEGIVEGPGIVRIESGQKLAAAERGYP